MPVLIDRASLGCTILTGKESVRPPRRHPSGCEWIEVGLVNNMPDAALESTEQQFLDLLAAAAGESWVRVRFLALRGAPRSERMQRHLRQSYLDTADIGAADLDGLIVTGTEPKAARLAEEPYWRAFTALADWARQGTISTIWSCLAAHAAVLYLDGIERMPLGEKCIGVFPCDKLVDHPFTQGLPRHLAIPHARWQPFAATFYRNWLSYLSSEKQQRLRPTDYLASLRLDQAPVAVI